MIYIKKHVNVLRLIGAVTGNIRNGQLMMVTEYCELGSLESYLRSGSSSLQQGQFRSRNEYAEG
jgi:Protein tyrosine and serine/threonine kinase